MMQKNISALFRRTALLTICFVFAFVAILPPPKASAGIPALQALVDSLSSCKNVTKGSDQWKKCEETQNILHWFAGCSDKMFGSEDRNGKRNIGKDKIDDCQGKINGNKPVERTDYLLKTIRNCKEVTKTVGEKGSIGTLTEDDTLSSGDWDQCESAQIGLTKLYGSKCDGLFDKIDKFGKDDASFNVERTNACEKQTKETQSQPATKPGEGKTSADDEGTEEDPCVSGSGELGWIMCPVIETGLNATDFVFKNFIQPMLENVPISAESGNGTYDAWKQFRLIGNIVLVGSLLAVVYAQARGEK